MIAVPHCRLARRLADCPRTRAIAPQELSFLAMYAAAVWPTNSAVDRQARALVARYSLAAYQLLFIEARATELYNKVRAAPRRDATVASLRAHCPPRRDAAVAPPRRRPLGDWRSTATRAAGPGARRGRGGAAARRVGHAPA